MLGLLSGSASAEYLLVVKVEVGRAVHDHCIELLALLRVVNAETHSSGRISAASADCGGGMLAQVRALPLEQREVLVLAAVEKLSYAEIAALLRVPPATVVARLAQARETLRTSASNPASAPNAN